MHAILCADHELCILHSACASGGYAEVTPCYICMHM